MRPNITRTLLVTPVWELLAEYVDDANLGQRATAKNLARLDRSWYTIHSADLRHFIIYDCHGISSLAEAGKVLQAICGYQRAVIKGLLVVRRSHRLCYSK